MPHKNKRFSFSMILIAVVLCTTVALAKKPYRVLILPFTIHSDQDLSFLKKGVGNMLSTRLTVADEVVAISIEATQEMLQNVPEPIDEAKLNAEDNLEEFAPLSEEDLRYFQGKAHWFEERGDQGSILVIPGSAFGDIALVPAPFLKHPKGIRDVAEWYMSTKVRRDLVYEIFERQCEVALQNIATLIELMGDRVQVALITGTDLSLNTLKNF